MQRILIPDLYLKNIIVWNPWFDNNKISLNVKFYMICFYKFVCKVQTTVFFYALSQ
jgi:hypothetical protein